PQTATSTGFSAHKKYCCCNDSLYNYRYIPYKSIALCWAAYGAAPMNNKTIHCFLKNNVFERLTVLHGLCRD
ncbi:MAG: hypothetical protein ACXVIW_05085, partial [Halobacteriota archaeon]